MDDKESGHHAGRQLYHSGVTVGGASEDAEPKNQRPSIDEAIKLVRDDDSVEPLKETLPSVTQSQLQNTTRRIARGARALLAGSHGSPHVNLISKVTS